MSFKPDSASKAAIPIEILKMDAALIKRLFTSPIKRRQGKAAPGYRRDVVYAFMRQMLDGLGTEQTQFLIPTTEKVYTFVTKLKSAIPKTVDLSDGALGHWIGDTQANNVLLYLHGGGFYAGATAGHVSYLYTLQREMAKRGHDFSIFMLSYTLSPGSVYPTQLKQAALALNYLIVAENRDPSTILLGGDSAGGNLTAALLQHIARPHPEVPRITLTRPLHAALLISPWVSFQVEGPTFDNSRETDYITSRALARAAGAYIAQGTGHDFYSEPATAPPEWWAEIATGTLRHIFIWGGGGEVLLGGIQSFADTVQTGFARAEEAGGVPVAGGDSAEKSTPRFTFVITPEKAHEEMIIDELFLRRKKSEAATEIENWLSAVLGV